MEKVIRNVADIEAGDRRALEHLIGKHLTEHQQVIINILDLGCPDETGVATSQEVPPWRNIYEGLSNDEIDRLDQAIRLRANLTRVFE